MGVPPPTPKERGWAKREDGGTPQTRQPNLAVNCRLKASGGDLRPTHGPVIASDMLAEGPDQL
jgi:hypothetical protein